MLLGSPRSTCSAMASPPLSRISLATASAPSRLISATTTWPPSDVSLRAVAKPMPPAPPVDRKSVVEGTSVSVRVDLGGRRIIKKKKYNKNEQRLNDVRTR